MSIRARYVAGLGRTVLLFVPAMFLAAAAMAQVHEVTGRVLDGAGRPVAGAVVSLEEIRRGGSTDTTGVFLLARVPAGRYTLVARKLGYTAQTRAVLLDRDLALDLTLSASPVVVEPISVTATRGPGLAMSSPLPTGALNDEALRREPGVSLAHALAGLAGVRVLGTGAQIGKPVIRGLAGSRVLVLDDGMRLEDYSWSEEDGPSADVGLAQRVEVIRGPASVLYGSDALGGVVNVISEGLPEARGMSRMSLGRVDVYAATNNAETGATVRLEGAGRGLGWRTGFSFRRAASLHTPDGELDNTGFTALSGEAALGLRHARGTTTLRIAHQGGEFKLLEANGPPAGGGGGADQGPVRKAGDDRLQVSGDYFVGPLRLETRAQWQRHSLIEVSDDAGGAPGQETAAFDLLLNTASLDVLAHHVAGSWLHGTFGVSGLYQTNDTRGPIPLVPDATVRGGAAFLFEEATFGRWSLLAGGRVDSRRIAADSNTTLALSATTRTASAWSGDVGLVFRPLPSLALAANIGRAWRAPNLFELFTNGPHLGEARYEIGKADLADEHGTNGDVSVRWQGGSFRAEVAAYRNQIDDFIYITPTAQYLPAPTPPDSLRVYRYVAANARLEGGEASAEWDAGRALTLHARGDIVRGTNRGTGEPLPLMPPRRVVVGADLHGDLSWASRARAGFEVEMVARQDRLNPLDLATGGYTLVGLEAGFTRTFAGRLMRIDLLVRNAGNVRYRDFLSRYKEFALDQGRNVLLRVSTAS